MSDLDTSPLDVLEPGGGGRESAFHRVPPACMIKGGPNESIESNPESNGMGCDAGAPTASTGTTQRERLVALRSEYAYG